MSTSEPLCTSCSQPTGGAHYCGTCKSPCHAIEPCSKRKAGVEYEEGYNTAVTCADCFEAETSVERDLSNLITIENDDQDKSNEIAASSKTLNKEWWKVKSSKSEVSSSGTGGKKRKHDVKESVNQDKTYTCVECFIKFSNGERKENTTKLSRNNSSSMQRHKSHWHQGKEKCTIVPSDAAELNKLRKKNKKDKYSKNTSCFRR